MNTMHIYIHLSKLHSRSYIKMTSHEWMVISFHWPFQCLFESLSRVTTKKPSNFCITGPFVWESTIGGFPTQMASIAESDDLIMTRYHHSRQKEINWIFKRAAVTLDTKYSIISQQSNNHSSVIPVNSWPPNLGHSMSAKYSADIPSPN